MISKIKTNKKEFILLLIAIFEILLLVNLTPAGSYLIHQVDSPNEDSKIELGNELSELVNEGINLLIGFLSIKQIGVVSAQSLVCCLDNCQDVEKEECTSENYLPTSCETISQCQGGTCVDESNGICSAGAPKYLCEEKGGIWYYKDIDDVNDCGLGCCTLDSGSKKYIRRIKCAQEGGTFDSSIDQDDCKLYTDEMGACVLSDGECKFVSEKVCETSLYGNFYVRSLCSNPNLGTNCEMPQKSEVRTTCYNNKVYFLDTCGNIANVYDASKVNDEDYWDFVEDSGCSVDLDEMNSLEECGNCDGVTNICDISSNGGVNADYGDYACKDLSCIDENGDIRENQESWCVYESYIGDSRDVVGSEYRIRWCEQGKIKTQLCGNYRSKVCTEKIIEGVSVARCRVNEGFKAFNLEPVFYEFDEDTHEITNYNEVNEYIGECESLSDARIQSIDLYSLDDESQTGERSNTGTLFKFDYCVPKYPPGLEFWEGGSNSEGLCGIASVSCTAVITKRRCKQNCYCLSQDWANQMNDFCISLGDCGGYVNIEGDYTKNFKTFDTSSLGRKWNKRTKSNEDADGDIGENKKEEYINYASDSMVGDGDLPEFFSSSETGYWGGDPINIQDITEIKDVLGTITSIVSAIAGLLGIIMGCLSETPVGLIVAVVVVAVIAVILFFISLFYKKRKITVTFTCKPWQAPMGGDNCEKCNEDPLRPCTEYKCKSLGTACALVSEGELYETENPLCINKYPDDVAPPQIIFEDIDNEEDYQITSTDKGVEVRSADGGCIKEFSDINFTLKTETEKGEEDYSKCVYNLESVDPPGVGNDYTLNGEYFTESTFFSITHNFDNKLPFVSSLDSISGNLGEREGEFNMYVRCTDYAGNPNYNEYIINICLKEGQDVEPAIIKEYTPKDGSYIKYGETEQILKIDLNEPVECRWSHAAEKPYDDMMNDMICEDYLGYSCDDSDAVCTAGTCANCVEEEAGDCDCEDNDDCGTCIEQSTVQSRWWCTTTLKDLTFPENNIYIKCKDQPWISEEDYNGLWSEEDRNVNTLDFEYTLYSTESELKIDSISPDGKVIVGGEISEIELKVGTSGGVYNGVAICKYEFLESPSDLDVGDFFFDTNSKTHKQFFNLQEGSYNLLITCKDEIGNKAVGNAIFDVDVDNDAPIVARVYKDGSNLKLITDEKAKCYYSTENCYFDLNENTSITSVLSTMHTIVWEQGVTYSIKCQDSFGNIDSGCTKKIIPSS